MITTIDEPISTRKLLLALLFIVVFIGIVSAAIVASSPGNDRGEHYERRNIAGYDCLYDRWADKVVAETCVRSAG